MNMPTRYLFSFVVVLASCSGHLFADDTRANVVFLAVDDMNDFVGCLESRPNAITPHIDRLAAGGVCFTGAHTAGVFRAPSRASIFSGQYLGQKIKWSIHEFIPEPKFLHSHSFFDQPMF
nr:sulfatase-like hydrolase/transferase [Rhodopirellula sp. SM50]